jgi:acyl-CoA thioester hydrolase
MARIQIELPEHLPFATDITLYQSHMNYGGHLDNALLLSVVSEARMRFFQSLGYTELDVEGVGIIVADAALQYRSEAFHGEVMHVRMAAGDFGRKGCDLLWCMSERSSQREVARGKTGIVFFNYATRQSAAVPPGFRARVDMLGRQPPTAAPADLDLADCAA